MNDGGQTANTASRSPFLPCSTPSDRARRNTAREVAVVPEPARKADDDGSRTSVDNKWARAYIGRGSTCV